MGFDAMEPLPSPSGAVLHLLRSLPREPPRAVVQINHGLCEHAGRYARFASFLAGRGFAAYAHDHRGHGETRAPDAPRGTFGERNGAAKVLDDVSAAHDRIAAEHPGVPVVVLGHSMGGLIALNFLQRHPARAAAAAIWNADFSQRAAARVGSVLLLWERFRLGSDVPSRILPRLTFAAWGESIAGARTPFDWLSHDEGEVEAYRADPACGWLPSVAMWRDVLALALSGGNAERLARLPKGLPLHLVGGGEDPATANGKAVAWLSHRLGAAGLLDVTTRHYPGARHETLNDGVREEAMADFADWIDARLPRHPAGPRTGLGRN